MLPRSLGSAARRLAAAPTRACASSASSALRTCPPSDGDEPGHDGLPPTPTEPEERRWPRRGEDNRPHHRNPHHRPHMANGLLLRAASPSLRPAAAATADSDRGHSVVTIGDSGPRGVALRVAGSRRKTYFSTHYLKLLCSSRKILNKVFFDRRAFSLITAASRDHSGLTRQLLDFQHDTVDEVGVGVEHDPFMELKARFMDFKQRNYVENFSNYQSLAEQQTPKFMVVACADSRVCPSRILGFQPGEAFTVRNVANLVPPYEHGGSETSAALEFAVNSLQV
nr:unnamed protein product [Digitaria exilis]